MNKLVDANMADSKAARAYQQMQAGDFGAGMEFVYETMETGSWKAKQRVWQQLEKTKPEVAKLVKSISYGEVSREDLIKDK